jgi:hypothetical protein
VRLSRVVALSVVGEAGIFFLVGCATAGSALGARAGMARTGGFLGVVVGFGVVGWLGACAARRWGVPE